MNIWRTLRGSAGGMQEVLKSLISKNFLHGDLSIDQDGQNTSLTAALLLFLGLTFTCVTTRLLLYPLVLGAAPAEVRAHERRCGLLLAPQDLERLRESNDN